MLYPQNGDRIVTTDSVMSLHTMYKIILRRHSFNCIASLSLHKEWKDLDNNADMRVNTNYNHAISDKKIGELWSSNPGVYYKSLRIRDETKGQTG